MFEEMDKNINKKSLRNEKMKTPKRAKTMKFYIISVCLARGYYKREIRTFPGKRQNRENVKVKPFRRLLAERECKTRSKRKTIFMEFSVFERSDKRRGKNIYKFCSEKQHLEFRQSFGSGKNNGKRMKQ